MGPARVLRGALDESLGRFPILGLVRGSPGWSMFDFIKPDLANYCSAAPGPVIAAGGVRD